MCITLVLNKSVVNKDALRNVCHYASPIKWEDILFLAPLSICPSVRLSVRPSVRPSVRLSARHTFVSEPLVGFSNNFAQMSSMMRQSAVTRFDQGRFKVKVTI